MTFSTAGVIAQVLDDFCGLSFGGVEQKASGDAAIILDRLQQLLLVLLAHAWQDRESFPPARAFLLLRGSQTW